MVYFFFISRCVDTLNHTRIVRRRRLMCIVYRSTLINRLVPDAKAATNIISQALQSGKHTTTSTTWYWADESKTPALMDSPGFQAFGLHHIAPQALASCMPDIAIHADHCKFHNCSHVHEPDCGVRQALL